MHPEHVSAHATHTVSRHVWHVLVHCLQIKPPARGCEREQHVSLSPSAHQSSHGKGVLHVVQSRGSSDVGISHLWHQGTQEEWRLAMVRSFFSLSRASWRDAVVKRNRARKRSSSSFAIALFMETEINGKRDFFSHSQHKIFREKGRDFQMDQISGPVKESILFGVDIETSGCMMTQNHIVAIGYYACRLDGRPLMKKRVSFAGPHNFEQRCVDEFWSKNSVLYDTLMKNAVECSKALGLFINDLDSLESSYTVALVSDNPSFDFAWINYYLDRYLGRRPLSFPFGGTTYRSVFDTDCFARGVIRSGYKTPGDFWTYDSGIRSVLGIQLPEGVATTHYPDDDAQYIVEMHRQVMVRM